MTKQINFLIYLLLFILFYLLFFIIIGISNTFTSHKIYYEHLSQWISLHALIYIINFLPPILIISGITTFLLASKKRILYFKIYRNHILFFVMYLYLSFFIEPQLSQYLYNIKQRNVVVNTLSQKIVTFINEENYNDALKLIRQALYIIPNHKELLSLRKYITTNLTDNTAISLPTILFHKYQNSNLFLYSNEEHYNSYELAKKTLQKKDYPSAIYYADQALKNSLFKNYFSELKNIKQIAHNELNTQSITEKTQLKNHAYLLQSAAQNSFNMQNYNKALYLTLNSRILNPDNETELSILENKIRSKLNNIVIYQKELEYLNNINKTSNIIIDNTLSNTYTELLFFKKTIEMGDIIYGINMHIIRFNKNNELIFHAVAPLAKIMNNTIITTVIQTNFLKNTNTALLDPQDIDSNNIIYSQLHVLKGQKPHNGLISLNIPFSIFQNYISIQNVKKLNIYQIFKIVIANYQHELHIDNNLNSLFISSLFTFGNFLFYIFLVFGLLFKTKFTPIKTFKKIDLLKYIYICGAVFISYIFYNSVQYYIFYALFILFTPLITFILFIIIQTVKNIWAILFFKKHFKKYFTHY